MARSRTSRVCQQQRGSNRVQPPIMQQQQHKERLNKQQAAEEKEEEEVTSSKLDLLQQLEKSRSIPSSPTRHAAEKEHEAAATAATAPPSPSSIVDKVKEEEKEAAPQPAFTAEEESMRATIRSVRDKLAQIEFELPTLQRQIDSHCSQLQDPSSASASTPSKLHLAHTHLHYSAGMVDERVMQAIFKLDALQTSNPAIRTERKATVAKGNTIIAESIQLREKLQQASKLLPPKEQEETKKEEESAPQQPLQQQQPASPTQQQQQQPTAMVEDESAEDEEEEDSDEEMEQKYAEPAAAVSANKQQQPTRPRASAAAPTPAPATAPAAPTLTPLQRKYAHLRLPVWAAGPTFRSRVESAANGGGLVIDADMHGVAAADLKVTADPVARTLTVQGVKLPSRQHQQRRSVDFGFFGLPAAAAPVEPHGFFTRVISLADVDPHSVLDLESMHATLDANEKLEVAIPRHAPVQQVRRAQPQRQQQYQRPSPFFGW